MNGPPSLHLFSYPFVNMIFIKYTIKANVIIIITIITIIIIIRTDLSKIYFWASHDVGSYDHYPIVKIKKKKTKATEIKVRSSRCPGLEYSPAIRMRAGGRLNFSKSQLPHVQNGSDKN